MPDDPTTPMDEACSSVEAISFRVVRPYRSLLKAATELTANPDTPVQYQAAIVLAQTACEMCTEDTLKVFFQVMGLSQMFAPTFHSVQSFNLARGDRVRRIYIEVSGDQIVHQPFWAAYTELPKKRNNIVHAGEPTTKDEAERLCAIALQFIDHVEKVGNSSPAFVKTPLKWAIPPKP